MAARKVLVPWGVADTLIALSTSTETVLQILFGTNHPGEIFFFSIYGDSTSLNAVPIPAEWLIQTSAGTSGTAVTEALKDRGITHTIQLSANTNFSAEPTDSAAVLWPFQFAPSSGFLYTWPQGDELVGNTAERLGLRCLTPAAAFNANGLAECRE